MTEDVFGILGTTVAGAFQVEAVVAEGGFGVVYRAYHSGFRAPVALKCLKVPQQLSAEQEAQFLEQFRAEAELLFRLSASIPTVVRPLHVDAMSLPDGRFVPYMALEWLEGETLEAIAQRRKAEGSPPIPLKKLVRMLTPVARALERAHNYQGPTGPISIVHRDLKPENIFVANVAGEEVVKILDFGIGKAKSMASQVAGRASQTQSAFSSFTPAYGAPEQWVPKRYGQTGPWTDVWGLALTMVEILAGRNVIDGDQAAMMGTALDPKRRPTPKSEGLDVSEAVEAVFARALALDPRERYAEAGQFWTELIAALGMRADATDFYSYPPRDPRAEAGAIPRVENVGAAAELPRRRLSSGAMQAATIPADAALAAGVYPDVADSVGEHQMPAALAPELGEIPDLAPAPVRARQERKKSQRPPAYARELDFDESTSNKLQLDVDLAPGERPSLRVPAPGSRPDWPLPEAAAEPEPRRRVSSGASPVARGPTSAPPGRVPPGTSGAYRAMATEPAPPPNGSSVRPPGAVSASSSAAWKVSDLPPLQVPLPSDPPSVAKRVAPGAVLVLLSILVTFGGQMYAASSGEVFSLGPIRATWIAGLLMLVGVVLIAIRLIPGQRT
jgi:eukaryotic-like serine/threonine-protein kinase